MSHNDVDALELLENYFLKLNYVVPHSGLHL
jgi:hypothetical protein